MPAKIKTTKKPLTPEMARLVRRRREAAGMSQLELARKVGVARAQIKRIEAAEVAKIDETLAWKITSTLVPEKEKKRAINKVLKKLAKVTPLTRRERIVRALERAGLLDMTLRDLLAA